MAKGDTWQISYTHSWFRVPQEECYEANESGQMILKEMRFGSYSAALYYNESPEQGITLEDGIYKILNINLPMDHFYFKVGYTTNCCLHIRDKVIPFVSLVPPGHSLEICIQKLNRLEYLLLGGVF